VKGLTGGQIICQSPFGESFAILRYPLIDEWVYSGRSYLRRLARKKKTGPCWVSRQGGPKTLILPHVGRTSTAHQKLPCVQLRLVPRPTPGARLPLLTHFSVTCEMGQGFCIAAPSVNEVLHWGCVLGEILFDGSAKSIVRLLAVPVRPERFHYETRRMLVQRQSEVESQAARSCEVVTSWEQDRQKLRGGDELRSGFYREALMGEAVAVRPRPSKVDQ